MFERFAAPTRRVEQMQQILARGGVLATLADQDAGPRGLFVDFFGRPASTHKAIALLALEFQVPMLVCGSFSDHALHSRGSFRASLERCIYASF